ncbi:MAG TPA: hypothetical protein VL282_03510, partial [Tepidisphaeraceae bacterium]|nr:hypothetical protein [Tepidisphaeraceae bacterium]
MGASAPSRSRSYPEWKAPAEDGHILIWPEPADLLRDAQQNHARLSQTSRVLIQGIPLSEWRARQREWIGHRNHDQLIVATGHQTELSHPGVWVKNALINAAAKKLGGEAYHIAVDTDAPKHLHLRWPGESIPITDDPALNTAAWSGAVHAPTPAHLARIEDDLSRAMRSWNFKPMLPSVLSSLRRLSLESPNVSSAVTNATHELDWELGLRHHALLASPIWMSGPYLVFVHHVMARADEYAAKYNQALAEYRKRTGTRTASRPMPDLFCSGEACETPFWLDDMASGKRVRPSVFRRDNEWLLELVSGAEFRFDANAKGWDAASALNRFLVAHNMRLAPRALTLTMFLRLAVVDQFVHGIGGGRYDQVTDRLIELHFEIEAPRFAVTTGTLIFPQAVGQSRVCLPCVLEEGHRLRHSLLGERKKQLVAQIEDAPRRSHQRAELFGTMHRELRDAAKSDPLLAKWNDRVDQTR